MFARRLRSLRWLARWQTRSYRTGDHARRAANESAVRALQLARIVLGVLIALAIGVVIENYQWPNKFFVNDTGGVFGLSVLAVGMVYAITVALQRTVRHKISLNGSFIYVSCLPGADDYDLVRFERSVSEQFVDSDLGQGSRLFDGAIRLTRELDHDNPKESLGSLVDTFRHAANADDSTIPTNLLCNLLWPIGIEFGRQARIDDEARLWYLPERWEKAPTWHAAYTWLAGDLLDVIDLADLRANHPKPIPADELGTVEVAAGAHASGEIVRLALSGPIPDRGSQDAFDRMVTDHGLTGCPITELSLYQSGEEVGPGRWLKDPGLMGIHAVKAASLIHHACTRSNRVIVAARLAKPESVAVGHLLRAWQSLEGGTRVGYANYSPPRGAFDVWSFEESSRLLPDPAAHELVNLTSHPVSILDQNGRCLLEVPPSGSFARVADTTIANPPLTVDGITIPVTGIQPGPVVDLPPHKPGVLLIASRITAQRCTGRPDVVFPYEEVRDRQGSIIGCRQLARFTVS